MKKLVMLLCAVVVVAVFVTSTGFTADTKYSGFLGDLYKNLQPGPKDGAKERWLKPGVMFGKYNKFIMHPVTFFFAEGSEYKGIDPNEMKELADAFNQAIRAAFKDKYPLTIAPGPDVARVCIAITGLKASKPALSAVTSVLPVGLAVSGVKKGATGSWSGSGTTSAELVLLDSLTHEPILAAVDERSAAFGERFSKWESANEAFKYWAERMVMFMDDTRGMKRSTHAAPESTLSRAGEEIPGEAGQELIGVTWKWHRTVYDNNTKILAAKPDNYTLKLLPDGQVTVQGDCNLAGGSYRIKEEAISIEITNSTLAACPPESQSQSYLRDLGAADSYFLDDNTLYIDLKYDSGTMKFLR